MTGRGDLTEAEWRRLEPLLPTGNNRCGQWRDHRQVVNGILHRVRTGVQWRDADGTRKRLLQQVQAAADAAGEIDWDISVDSTIVRAHQHVAGARTDPPPAPASKGTDEVAHQDESPWQSLVARLVEVVPEARAWAGRAAGSPASST